MAAQQKKDAERIEREGLEARELQNTDGFLGAPTGGKNLVVTVAHWSPPELTRKLFVIVYNTATEKFYLLPHESIVSDKTLRAVPLSRKALIMFANRAAAKKDGADVRVCTLPKGDARLDSWLIHKAETAKKAEEAEEAEEADALPNWKQGAEELCEELPADGRLPADLRPLAPEDREPVLYTNGCVVSRVVTETHEDATRRYMATFVIVDRRLLRLDLLGTETDGGVAVTDEDELYVGRWLQLPMPNMGVQAQRAAPAVPAAAGASASRGSKVGVMGGDPYDNLAALMRVWAAMEASGNGPCSEIAKAFIEKVSMAELSVLLRGAGLTDVQVTIYSNSAMKFSAKRGTKVITDCAELLAIYSAGEVARVARRLCDAAQAGVSPSSSDEEHEGDDDDDAAGSDEDEAAEGGAAAEAPAQAAAAEDDDEEEEDGDDDDEDEDEDPKAAAPMDMDFESD